MSDRFRPLKIRDMSDTLLCAYISDVQQKGLRGNSCYRMSYTEDDIPKLMQNNEYRSHLVSLGIFDHLPTDDEIRTVMTYAFFLPNSKVTFYVNEFVQNLHRYPSLGVQIRTGGSLASDNEESVFFSQSTLYRVIDMINRVLTENYIFDYNLFISTDSQEILTELKASFPQLMHTSDSFKIGHTASLRSTNSDDHGNRALIDLMILSSCDYLIYTEDSSYGRLASALSFSDKKYFVVHK